MNKKSEFSHIILTEDVTKKPLNVTFDPSDGDLDAVCKRLGIEALVLKQASATLKRMEDGCTIYVSGQFSGTATQNCVVTLEPVEELIRDDFESYYLDDSKVKSFENAKRLKQVGNDEDATGVSERRMPELHEEPDLVRDGKINLGELLIQSISLALNPYPRAASEIEGQSDGDEKIIYADQKESPFAALKDHVSQKKT